MNKTFTIGLIALSCFAASAQSFVVTDTKQDLCYDEQGNVITCPTAGNAFYGQDANYTGVTPSYTDNNDGTVTDGNTGLMWQQSYLNTRTQYDAACTYCENLSLAGFTDWRLPTIKELFSISDFRGELLLNGTSTPYLDENVFDFTYPSMPFTAQYWSITKYVKGPIQDNALEGAFGFNFADGHIKAYETGYYWNGNTGAFAPGNFVRCVRGQSGIYGVNNFQDNGDSTVTDLATNLMWQQGDDGTGRDWENAMAYCENLTLAGHSDWRLPDVKELQSIVDYEKLTWPTIDSVFEMSDPDSWYWTGTTHGDHKEYACYISFGRAWSSKTSSDTTFYDWHGAGAMRSDPKYGNPANYTLASPNASDLVRITNYARCVRAGAPVGTPEYGTARQLDLRIFPNPTSDFVQINVMDANESEEFTLVLSDAVGKELLKTSFNTTTKVNLKSLQPSGVVLIAIYDTAGQLLERQAVIVE